ncbi:MAG TPA: ABC transporter ATP-binding protein [Puia sp.]|nr:ABC transporter ATP-binding protein [Puia sp.]
MANPYLSLLRTSWHYSRNERKRYVLVYSLFVCASLVNACNPLLLGWFIGRLQKDMTHVWHFTLLYVIGYIGLKFFQWCFHGPARIMERMLAFNLSRNFLQEKYHQVLHLPVKWQQDHHSGAIINRVRKAYESLRDFFDRGFIFLYTLLKFVISVVAILYFSPLFGSIAVVMGIGLLFVIRTFNKPFLKAVDEVNEKEHIVSATLFDSLSNIMTVITLRLERSMETGLLARVRDIFRPFRRSAVVNEWKWFCAEMIIVLIYSMITMGYIWQHWTPGRLFEVGGLVALLGFVQQFTSVFTDVAFQYTNIMLYDSYVQTASVISEAYAERHRADRSDGLSDGWDTLRIDRLHFSYHAEYDSHRAQSLHDLNLTIRRGQRIALIGESGSGKTTLLSLLRGLYNPEPGTGILLDGRETSLEQLNESVTLFPQEPEIFENTLAYNITLGLPFPDEEVLRACDAAHFTDVIRQLPQGLETDIREKGVNLSGGQKQRLALARGILAARDSAIVLLDEPTSSVDPRTEALIYDGLFSAFADKAVISSVHRLHLLNHFDYIYILHQGRIIGEGTFDQLLANDPAFGEMWRHSNKSRQL